MRKIISLTGFILLLVGLLAEDEAVIYATNWLFMGFMLIIAGTIVMVIGLAINPSKELREPFKSISEKFDGTNKPLLIAAIFTFMAAGWLLFIGHYELLCYNVSGILYNYLSPSTNLTQVLNHNYNNTIGMLSIVALLSGSVYVAVGVNVLQKRNLGFILSSLVFGSIVSVLLGYYQKLSIDLHNSGSTGIISFGYYHYIALRIALPTVVLSILSFILVVWGYKEYKRKSWNNGEI